MPSPASASASTLASIESGHTDMVHDCQLDWYGRRLATCSSDRTVKIFDVEEGSGGGAQGSAAGGAGSQVLLDTLRGHDGPVWAVAWGHPKFGSILASAGYDGKVFVWREVVPGQQQQSYGQPQTQNARWERIKEHGLHGASVNAIAWAPHELGPILACASSDGKISVLTFNNDSTWDAQLFAAHNIGVNSISWAPAILPSSLIAPSTNPQNAQGQQGTNGPSTFVKKFATGGCDNLVKIWSYNEESKAWFVEETLEGHTDWVRDVAFAPGVGLPRTYLASAGQDRQVIIWTQDAPGQKWQSKVLDPLPYLSSNAPGANPAQQAQEGKFPDVVWRVSWSVTGNVLAVSAGDGKVSLWKENLKGAWECVSEVGA